MRRVNTGEPRYWSQLEPLSHLYKADYFVNDQYQRRADKMVKCWQSENPNATLEEKINFTHRILSLTLQIDLINNLTMLMDGRQKEQFSSQEDFYEAKIKERTLLPKFQDSLDKALQKTGRTGQAKLASKDIENSSMDIANYIWNRNKTG